MKRYRSGRRSLRRVRSRVRRVRRNRTRRNRYVKLSRGGIRI